MIVEIHGIDEERMGQVERILLSLRLSDITKEKKLGRKICLSADRGTVQLVNTHRKVFGADGIRVCLREPGELALTMEGSLQWIAFIAGALGAADILKNGGEFKLAKQLDKGHKK
ncbi:hypothetical protein KGQ34_04450 [Patescibacteria group bacterium]|nr:hypothetical protein [Patescibacteria group bacterium]